MNHLLEISGSDKRIHETQHTEKRIENTTMTTQNMTATRLDPRKEVVASGYLQLAADLLRVQPSDQYWNEVAVPTRPTDRVSFEELRQVAVFSPLALAVATFFAFGTLAGAVALVLALGLMKLLHDALQRAINEKGSRARQRDAGRFAFTTFMCKQFDLKPEDVTLDLVKKMCAEHMREAEVKMAALRNARADVAAKRTAKLMPNVKVDPAFVRTPGVATAAFATGVTAAGVAAAMDMGLRVNPVTGLPLIADGVDVLGNVAGLSNADDGLDFAAPVADTGMTFDNAFPDFDNGFTTFENN
jgi:hypothetical protein